MDPKDKLAIMQVLHLSVGDRWGWISGFTVVKTDSPATYGESRLRIRIHSSQLRLRFI